jgi:hypothetical protein
VHYGCGKHVSSLMTLRLPRVFQLLALQILDDPGFWLDAPTLY